MNWSGVMALSQHTISGWKANIKSKDRQGHYWSRQKTDKPRRTRSITKVSRFCFLRVNSCPSWFIDLADPVFLHSFRLEFNSKSGTSRHFGHSVGNFQWMHEQLIQPIKVFQVKPVANGGQHVNVNLFVEMWRQQPVEALRQMGDLQTLAEAANAESIGLKNRSSLAHQEFAKHTERILTLTGCNWNGGAGRNLAIAIEIVFAHRLFEPEKVLILHLAGEGDGLGRN